MQVIPAVDVLDGRVVRLLHGDYDRVTVYGEDPVATARHWVEQGAAMVHVVDLEGARTGEPSETLWESLADAQVPFQVGGGIRTADVARRALAEGAHRVVMGTAAVWRPEVLAEVGDAERVVAAVDVLEGRATGSGWLDRGRAVGRVLENLADAGVRRALVTGIRRDGTMEGPEIALLRQVLDGGRLAVIASGGVGSVDDLRALADLGCEAAVVGRALYEGRLSLSEALDA